MDSNLTKLQKNLKNHKYKILLTLVWGGFFLSIWPRMLYYDKAGMWSGYFGVWADWAVHLAYINRFVHNPISAWFTNHPIYLGRKFTYHLLPDLLSALLIKIGFSDVFALIIPSIIATGLFIFMMYKLFKAFLKSDKAIFLAITLFFTLGGIGFIYFFQDTFAQIFSSTHIGLVEYTRMPERYIHWVALIPGQLLAQRSLLFGFPILMFIALTLYRWISIPDKKTEKQEELNKSKVLQIIGLGILSASLLLIHAHGFIVLFMVAATFSIMRLRSWKTMLLYGISVILASLPIYLIMYHGGVGTKTISWYPGWMARTDGINWLSFWIINWGLFFPLVGYSIWKTKLYKDPMIVSGIVVFIMANLFTFQSWDWDNMKILNWSALVFCIPVVKYFVQVWNGKQKLFKIILGIVLVSTMLAGTVDTLRIFDTSSQKALAWTHDDIELANSLTQITDETDIILTSDYHHHFVTSLSGRQVVMGYAGWLVAYGIDYQDRMQDIRIMYSGGEESLKLLEEYGVTHAVIGPSEISDYRANEQFFVDNFELILENSQNRIYEL